MSIVKPYPTHVYRCQFFGRPIDTSAFAYSRTDTGPCYYLSADIGSFRILTDSEVVTELYKKFDSVSEVDICYLVTLRHCGHCGRYAHDQTVMDSGRLMLNTDHDLDCPTLG